jgi:hypothetical protein
MVLAGSANLAGMMPAEDVAEMGLSQEITLIGVGCLASGLLLAIPRTASIGVLLVSS